MLKIAHKILNYYLTENGWLECSSSLAFVITELDLYDDRAFKGKVVTNL
jgi:hypothetical protein